MLGLLSKSGHAVRHTGTDFENSKDDSEIEIINICTVKGDQKALREIRRKRQQHPDKKIIVAGCITQSIIPKIKELDEGISLLNTHNFGSISTAVEQQVLGNPVELLDKKYESKVNLPSVRKNPVIGITPILNSCNYACTYCSTKLIKGRLVSYPMDTIRTDVKNHLAAGCKEIWITSQDTGAYMVEQGGRQKLPELLAMILSIPADFKLRLGMMNPGNTIKILDELIAIYRHPKMYKFLHIPVQCGNNEILKKMNRQYTVKDYYAIVAAFKKKIPKITISTDIIAGFPTETEEQFEDSMELLRKTRPDAVNLSGFVWRDGTVAARLPQLPSNTIHDRTRRMAALFHIISAENNKQWLGWQGKILVSEKGKFDTWVGRNYCYKPVVVKENCALGDEITVKITDSGKFDIRGEIVRNPS